VGRSQEGLWGGGEDKGGGGGGVDMGDGEEMGDRGFWDAKWFRKWEGKGVETRTLG